MRTRSGCGRLGWGRWELGLPSDELDAPAHLNKIKAAPKLGNVYWCQFPADARKPEFWKTRPVVVISYANSLLGPVLVVPLTTKDQGANKWAFRLEANPVPKDSRPSSAVCNHLYTVACSRLVPIQGKVPRLTGAELEPIIQRVRDWVARPQPLRDHGED